LAQPGLPSGSQWKLMPFPNRYRKLRNFQVTDNPGIVAAAWVTGDGIKVGISGKRLLRG